MYISKTSENQHTNIYRGRKAGELVLFGVIREKNKSIIIYRDKVGGVGEAKEKNK